MKNKCTVSGRSTTDHFTIDGWWFANCPTCGRQCKLRFATGGYDGFAKYLYFPTHNSGTKPKPKEVLK